MKLSASLKLALSALAVIAATWAGMLAMDGRYARAADVKEQFQKVNEQLKDARLDTLYRDQEECDKSAAKLKAGEKENARCQRVRKQIKALEEEKR